MQTQVMHDDDTMELLFDMGEYIEADRVFFKRVYLAIREGKSDFIALRQLQRLDEQFWLLDKLRIMLMNDDHPFIRATRKQATQAEGNIYVLIHEIALQLIVLTGITPDYTRYSRRCRRIVSTEDDLALPGK